MGSEERKIVKKTRNELCEKGLNIKNLKGSTLNEKHKVFPHVLFRDIVINEERILKALRK